VREVSVAVRPTGACMYCHSYPVARQ
jgi:hypothetical protein